MHCRGTHAFRRNAITKVINNSNGNVVLTAQMYGNSPETIRKHYYVGEDIERKREVVPVTLILLLHHLLYMLQESSLSPEYIHK